MRMGAVLSVAGARSHTGGWLAGRLERERGERRAMDAKVDFIVQSTRVFNERAG